MEDAPFHVYLMMPLHSEGLLNSPMMMGVMHQTMQTITFGTHSLINLIKRALLEKEYLLRGETIDDLDSDDLSARLWKMSESRWSKYLTLLYGRNFDRIPQGPLVTEQIYVHSKCMIVDDNVVIVGSANINDRSLMGDRDSEIAAMIVDPKCTQATLCGNKPAMVRQFARDLRQSLWKKHLGLTESLPPGGPQAAANMASILEAPASAETVAKIQALARSNSQAYESAFPWVPRNVDVTRKNSDGQRVTMGSSIWPAWESENDDTKQPWSEAFSYPVGDEAQRLQNTLAGQVKGFWCSYPYRWTQGQNNYDPRIALELLSQEEQPRDTSANSSHA
jgi:phospholipase D1/2